MSFRFIEDHRDAYPVRLMCSVLEVSAAGYYAWRGRPVSARTATNAALLADIRQVHQDSSARYGSMLHRRDRRHIGDQHDRREGVSESLDADRERKGPERVAAISAMRCKERERSRRGTAPFASSLSGKISKLAFRRGQI